MARKELIRDLPPLSAKLTLKSREHKEARLVELLRGIAFANQSEQPRVFYSMRDVARHSNVPVSMIARVYGKLEQEGILTSVRGSKTLLQGRSSGRYFSILGFVGMPAATSLFVTQQEYRTFFIRTRRELRARGFAVATIFFEPGDIKSGRLITRIKNYGVDTLFWHQPDRAAKETISHLEDTALRVVGLRDRDFPAVIQCRYEIQRETAIRTILRDWRSKSAITSVIIVRGPQNSAADEEVLCSLLAEEDITCLFKRAGDRKLETFLEQISPGKASGIIFSSLAASMFAFRAPHALAKLMTRARVALTGGVPSIPFAQVPEVRADIVFVDWQLIAERMVSDLVSKKAFDRGATTVFAAEARLGAALNHYAQSL